jgi:CheY-like chemotaxis protein
MTTTQANPILVAVDDMFFAARIRSTAEALGRQILLVKTAADLLKQAESISPALIILDLNSERLDPIKSIEQLKSRPELKGLPIIGFLSHVQTDLKKSAEEAGCDYVMPRSAFTQRLPELLAGNGQ